MNLGDHLEKLHYFHAISTSRSMQEAAKKVNISQPSLSYAIKQLEETLDIQLLIRSRKGTTLTPAGKILKELAEKLVYETVNTENKILSLKGDYIPHKIRIASHGPHLGSIVLPAFNKIKKVYPDLEINFSSRQVTQELFDKVLSCQYDMAFVIKELGSKEIESTYYTTDYYIFVHAKKLESKLTPIKLSKNAFKENKFIYHKSSIANKSETLEKLLKRSNINIESAYDVNDIEMAKLLTLEGYGIGLLPYHFVKRDIELGTLTQVKTSRALEKLGEIRVNLIRRRDNHFANKVVKQILESSSNNSSIY